MIVAVYPMMFDLKDKACLVVGGGLVALRKVLGLLRAGACVTVVAPVLHRHFQKLLSRIRAIERPYADTDISTALALVIGATDIHGVNVAISRRAAALRVPCNIVDCPDLCTFTVPAALRRGDLTIAVTTGGSSPRLSRYVKERIAAVIGPEYATLASYMKEVRKIVRDVPVDSKIRSSFWEELFAIDPEDFIAHNGWPAYRGRTDRLIAELRGKARAS